MLDTVVLSKGVLKNFAKFTGKHMYRLLNEVADLSPATLLALFRMEKGRGDAETPLLVFPRPSTNVGISFFVFLDKSL